MRERRAPRRTVRHILAAVVVMGLLLPLIVAAGARAATSSSASPAPYLVQVSAPLTAATVSSLSGKVTSVSYVWPDIGAMAVSATPDQVRSLQSDARVGFVEPDAQGFATTNESGNVSSSLVVVPLFTSATPIETWNLQMAETAGSGFDGSGVTVAVIDSGLPQNWAQFLPASSVDLTHAAGFGPLGFGSFMNPVNAIVGQGGHYGLFPHGLAVSSIIVGFPSPFGPVDGAAPGAKILPIRVLNQFNFGYFSWFIAAFLYVADLKASGAIPGPLVINFSIESTGYSQVLREAIDFAIAHGILFSTIAGNFGPSPCSISFPGNLPESITAGAAGWMGEGSSPTWFFGPVPQGDASQVYVATFSGRNCYGEDDIDVLAPGSFVFGEWVFGPGFSTGRQVAFDAMDNFIFGTSFASPHVAGILAQMAQKDPALTQAAAESILRGTALSVPDQPNLVFTPFEAVFPWDSTATGAGLVQGVAAVAATP